MKIVEPKAFFLGQMMLNKVEEKKETDSDVLPGVVAWLREIGGQEAVDCLDHVEGSDLEQLIELLARRCYKSFAPGLNPNVGKVRTDSAEYHQNILNQKHGSVTAHGHCTYAFENVSRVYTHELVRNSVGNDMSQESLRYVRLTDIKFWIPPILANETRTVNWPSEEEAKELGIDDVWCGGVYTATDIVRQVVEKCEWGIKLLTKLYDVEGMKDFDKKKLITSAMRRIAPEGLATGIGVTFNIRSLRWIIEQRTSPSAEEEIRIVFGLVARDAVRRWPMVLQDMGVSYHGGLPWYTFQNSKI